MAEESILGQNDSNNIKRIADAVEKTNQAAGTATGAISKTDELLTQLVEQTERAYTESIDQRGILEGIKEGGKEGNKEDEEDNAKEEGWFLSLIAFARWGKKSKERDDKLEKMKKGATFKFVKNLYDGVAKTATNILDLLMKGLGLAALWKLFSWIEEGGWVEYYDNIKATILGALETLKFVSLLKFIDWVKVLFGGEGGPWSKMIVTLKGWRDSMMKNKAIQRLVFWFRRIFGFGKGSIMGRIFGWIGPIIKMLPGMGKMGGILKKLLKVFGRLLWPITFLWGAWETISGFMKGYEDSSESGPLGKVMDGINGAVKAFLDFFIFGFAEMIQDGIVWILEFFGFEKAAAAVGDFDLVGRVKEALFFAIDFVTDLFKFDVSSVGEGIGKFIDIVFLPITLAVAFVQSIFGWGDPEEPFSFGGFIGGIIDGVINWVKKLFSDPVGALTDLVVGMFSGYVSVLDWLLWMLKKPIVWILEFFGFDDAAGDLDNWTLMGFIKETWAKVKFYLKNLLSWASTEDEGDSFIMKTVKNVITGVKEWFGKMFKFDSTSDILASVINVLTFFPNMIKDAIAKVTTYLLELFGFGDAAKKVANANKFSIGEMVMNALKAIGDFIAGLFDFDFGAIAMSVVDSLPNMVKMMIPDSWLEGIANSMDTDVEKEATKKSKRAGGPVQAMGIHKVNEEGMEMFMPLVPGKVIPAKETAMAMGGGGTPFVNAPVNNVSTNSGSTSMLMPSSSTDKSNWKYGMQGA